MNSSGPSRSSMPDPNSWTLEGDGKLLEYMESIAKNLENRCNKTTKDMNSMMLNVDKLAIDLGNTANKLQRLQQTQFIENRVQDEDIAMESSLAQDTKEKELLSDVEATKIVMEDSIKMLNKCYEKVSLDEDGEDSDVENENIRHIYKPINPYEDKRTPYIIGTKEWLEKWHIGLRDDTDSENEQEEEVESETESHNSIHQTPVASKIAPVVATEIIRDINDESENDATEEVSPVAAQIVHVNVPRITPAATHIQLPTQLIPGRQLVLPPNKQESPAPSATNFFRNQNTAPVASHYIVQDLLDDEPPELDTASMNESKIASNLFTESDDENENFIKPVQNTTNKTNTQYHDIFMKSEPPIDETDRTATIRNTDRQNNLTDNTSKTLQNTSVLSLNVSKAGNLFDSDTEDEDYFDIIKSTNKKKEIETPAKSTAKTEEGKVIEENPTKLISQDIEYTLHRNPVRSNKEASPITKSVNTVPTSKSEPKKTKVVENSLPERKVSSTVKKTANLFDDDSDSEDDFFGIKPKASLNKEQLSVSSTIPKVSVSPSVSKTTKTITKSLFADDDSGDEIFGTKSKKSLSISQPATKQSLIESKITKDVNTRTSDIFQQENNKTQDKAPKKVVEITPKPIEAKKPNNDQSDTIISTKPKALEVVTKKPINQVLFGDETDDELSVPSMKPVEQLKTQEISKIESVKKTVVERESVVNMLQPEQPKSNPKKENIPDDIVPKEVVESPVENEISNKPNISPSKPVLSAKPEIQQKPKLKLYESSLKAAEQTPPDANPTVASPNVENASFYSAQEQPPPSTNTTFDQQPPSMDSGNISSTEASFDSLTPENSALFSSYNDFFTPSSMTPKSTTPATPVYQSFIDDVPPDDDFEDGFETNDYDSFNVDSDGISPNITREVNPYLISDIPPEDDEALKQSSAQLEEPFVEYPEDDVDQVVARPLAKAEQLFDASPKDEIEETFVQSDVKSVQPHEADNSKIFKDSSKKSFGEKINKFEKSVTESSPKMSPKPVSEESLDFNVTPKDQTQAEQENSFKNKFNMFEKNTPALPEPKTETKDKPIPKKLNVNFNINVAALLPGAKRPSPPTKDDSIPGVTENETTQEIQIKTPPNENQISHVMENDTPKYNNEPAPDSKLLTSLAKSRVRAPVNRKPSTRKARLDRYNESVDPMQTNESEVPAGQVAAAERPVEVPEDQIKNVKKPVAVDRLRKVKLNETLSSRKSLSYDDTDESIVPSKVAVVQKANEMSIENLVAKSVGNTKNEVPANKQIDATESKINPSPKRKSLLFEEDDHAFDASNSEKILPSNKSENLLSRSNKAIASKVTPVVGTVSKPESAIKKTPLSAVFDSDSDDELFSNKPSTKVQSKQSLETASKQVLPTKKPNTGSLFESDEDEMFTPQPKSKPLIEKVVTVQSTQNPKKTKTNIFGSDEEEDNLFSTKKSTISKKEDSKSKVKAGQSKLFDDESDDDGLFGTATKGFATSKPVVTKTSKATSKPASSTGAIKKTAVMNDPLADLLK